MNEIKKVYNDFWKEIVEKQDGSLNKLQIMKELYDYYNVMHNCSCAYDLMSCGIISKPYTNFEAVRGLFNENYIRRKMADAEYEKLATEQFANYRKMRIVYTFLTLHKIKEKLQDNEDAIKIVDAEIERLEKELEE